jgi:hypothetical protein
VSKEEVHFQEVAALKGEVEALKGEVEALRAGLGIN